MICIISSNTNQANALRNMLNWAIAYSEQMLLTGISSNNDFFEEKTEKWRAVVCC